MASHAQKKIQGIAERRPDNVNEVVTRKREMSKKKDRRKPPAKNCEIIFSLQWTEEKPFEVMMGLCYIATVCKNDPI